MFNIIPSNRQEYLCLVLIELLNSDYANKHTKLFEKSTVMVESLGMQHYVFKTVAEHSGIAMNIEFPLVSRGIYQLCRVILGDNAVPPVSPFKREILTWRIERILNDSSFQEQEHCLSATKYWKSAPDTDKARFLLAQHTADVFEQYMQFRPQWLEAWQQNKDIDIADKNDALKTLEPWQKEIWRVLLQTLKQHDAIALYPSQIIQKATEAFLNAKKEGTHTKFDLPKSLYLFSVNTLTKPQMSFFKAISSTSDFDIYFFHLNPCMEYWGDIISESALLKQKIKHAISKLTDEHSPNALLANLGKQGRTLFNQLQDFDYLSFTENKLFATDISNGKVDKSPTLLQAVQYDILNATSGAQKLSERDNTVSIHSCHSQLREIQVLHDYLLHIISNENENIEPHDIIVLCPAIEDYAPYVKSVFRSTNQIEDNEEPKLVCSIADRTPIDSEPVINMFIDMLNLPDNRFSVTSIIDYLHIPSIQKTFGLTHEEVELYEIWIAKSNIFWAKDSEHKAHILGLDSESISSVEHRYTWQWGFERLLKSALSEFNPTHRVVDDYASLNLVEGQDLKTLGKLILFIETLQKINRELTQVKSGQAWIEYIKTNILARLFDSDSQSRAYKLISKCLSDLLTNIDMAEHTSDLPLSVIRQSISHHLSSPDTLNKFNSGQVTFCSMVPMRSVPFKVVCILGLNDGQFPRINQPLSIDLMVFDDQMPTDRSRRSEDRYMFLEAIISARDYLYLSYQGRNIKNNTKREPSLVLSEFKQYLDKHYGISPVFEHPLQPFSQQCFNRDELESIDWSQRPSFAKSWLDLAQKNRQKPEVQSVSFDFVIPELLDHKALLNFFSDPLASFCQHHLSLSFEKFLEVQSDDEPFETNNFQKYLLQVDALECLVESDTEEFERRLSFKFASGDIPPNTIEEGIYRKVYEDGTSLDLEQFAGGYIVHQYTCEIMFDDTKHRLKSNIKSYSQNENTTLVFLAKPIKLNHIFEFCIQHAIKRLSVDAPIVSKLVYWDIKEHVSNRLKYQNGEVQKLSKRKLVLEEFCLDESIFDKQQANAFLTCLLSVYRAGMKTPRILHVELASTLLHKRLLESQILALTEEINDLEAQIQIKTRTKTLEGTREKKIKQRDKKLAEIELDEYTKMNESAAKIFEKDPYVAYLFPEGIDFNDIEDDFKTMELIYSQHAPLLRWLEA